MFVFGFLLLCNNLVVVSYCQVVSSESLSSVCETRIMR